MNTNDNTFTLEQIKTAHAKVKSGADFPAYVQDMKALGIWHYDHFVADGRIVYAGSNGYSIDAPPKWPAVTVAETGNAEQLKVALAIHQQGQTDYPTFCAQSAAAGVEKWRTDMQAMRCTYYSRSGAILLTELIPG